MVNEQEYPDDAGEPRGADGGSDGDPGGLSGGRIPAPPIPRDEWVSQVVDDPSSGTQPVLLQGYVGDAADESRTRIYLDASLGTYVDVANDDVLHHQPLRGDHEPSGGSMVWVRGDAQVSQGTGGGADAAGGDFFTGPVLEQNRMAGMGGAPQAGGKVQITLLTVAGCITRGFACTLAGCQTQNFTCRTVHPIACSWVCQQGGGVGTPGGLGGVNPEGTMGYCPPSLGSPCHTQPAPCPKFEFPTDRVIDPQLRQFAAAAPAGGGETRYPCSAVDACPSALGCTSFGCPVEGAVTNACTLYRHCMGPGPVVGPTGWQGCGQPTHMIGCTGYQGCGQPHISLPGCIQTGTCPQAEAGPIGPTGWLGCGQPTHLLGCTGATAVTVCYCGPGPVSMHPGCPSPQMGAAGGGPIGPTGWLGCGQPHISLPGCIHTGPCPQGEAVTGPGSTIATVCTQIGCPVTGDGCPRTSTCPPTYTPGCGGAGAGGLMQAAHGGGVGGGGTSVATVCSQVGCPPHPAMGAEQGTAGIPTGQYAPQCPTFGFTCTYVHCPPMAIETRGLSCPTLGFTCTYVHCPPGAATVVTQGLGCPQSVSCPPETIATRGFGCPPTSTCPPTGGYGCPRTSTCPPTYAPGCGGAEAGGLMQAAHAGAAEGAAAAPTGQYVPQCPTFGFTCTAFCAAQGGMEAVGRTVATQCPTLGFTCTYVHCPPMTAAAVTQGLGCPDTSTCPPNTIVTRGFGCPQTISCPPATGGFGCPRTSTCPPTYTPGCGGTEVAAAGPYTRYQGCPTFGFTCTQFC